MQFYVLCILINYLSFFFFFLGNIPSSFATNFSIHVQTSLFRFFLDAEFYDKIFTCECFIWSQDDSPKKILLEQRYMVNNKSPTQVS